ncbi:MAG: CehA/McbA family metallohydrolase, partial [Roseiflexaceae bacterium]
AAITDHGELLDQPSPATLSTPFDTAQANSSGQAGSEQSAVQDAEKWAAAARQIAAANDEDFVAIRGFEWTSPRQGHSNVWCSTDYTSYHATGDDTMGAYYEWLAGARPIDGARVLAGFNHPGREAVCFDGCTFAPAVDDRIVTLECFNRGDDYGASYVHALDRGWHVGAIGVSDHHGSDWGSPTLPRAGVLAPALTLRGIQAALEARRVYATRSPTLQLLMVGNDALMGARLRPRLREPLTIGIWCDDPAIDQGGARLELRTNGGALVAAHETRGLRHISWRVQIAPRGDGEQWFFVRVLHGDGTLAYSSPIWARWD